MNNKNSGKQLMLCMVLLVYLATPHIACMENNNTKVPNVREMLVRKSPPPRKLYTSINIQLTSPDSTTTNAELLVPKSTAPKKLYTPNMQSTSNNSMHNSSFSNPHNTAIFVPKSVAPKRLYTSNSMPPNTQNKTNNKYPKRKPKKTLEKNYSQQQNQTPKSKSNASIPEKPHSEPSIITNQLEHSTYNTVHDKTSDKNTKVESMSKKQPIKDLMGNIWEDKSTEEQEKSWKRFENQTNKGQALSKNNQEQKTPHKILKKMRHYLDRLENEIISTFDPYINSKHLKQEVTNKKKPCRVKAKEQIKEQIINVNPFFPATIVALTEGNIDNGAPEIIYSIFSNIIEK